MRLTVFSDIHGNQYALRKMINDPEAMRADKFYFLGDIFGYYYGQEECLDILRKFNSLVCVLGNHDCYFLDTVMNNRNKDELLIKYGSSYIKNKDISEMNINFVKSWVRFYREEIDGIKLGFFHGSPEGWQEKRVYPDTVITNVSAYSEYDVVFLGHTHHKLSKKVGQTEIYNPGSVGQQRDGQGCSYLIYDTVKRKAIWREIVYEKEALVRDIEKNDGEKSSLKEVLFRTAEESWIYEDV